MKKKTIAGGKSTPQQKLTPEQLLQEIETAIQDLKRVEIGELKPRQVEDMLKARAT